ncbi:S-layer homology domain-containing protein [Paenibacillus sp. H1-7]|uniref:S-layer homology domain-containing protein n=1 Tax=Paenibacillus sp. H1-7 TaxID=2282849 RepID=UPI001EF84CE7|nr:S-layer homology domain-containing protein [Paenibacillus sp. H1-7]
MKSIRKKKQWSQTIRIGLVFALLLSGVPAAPPPAQAADGTPGGVDASGLRLWLKADPSSVTVTDQAVTQWRDSSPNGNHFSNDGTVAAIASRPKPSFVPVNEALNFQPTVKFVRSGGSILQDADGLLADGEAVNGASLFTITGGAPSMANSSIFNQPLVSGSMGAHIPHTSGAAAGKGNVLWDVGTTATRLTASNVVTPIDYNVWGMHFDANPAATVGSNVYQSISRDGKVEAQTTQARSPLIGKAGAAASLGSAAGGGSGYDGSMGEMILFTNPLTSIQKRQVETYLAVKYGITLKEGDYVSAGPAPQVVWNASAQSVYSHNIAGIALDRAGALDQPQSRSSQGVAAEQIIVTAKQALTDRQYLLWGDNGSTEPAIPFGSGYKRLARTWKVQNTGNTGPVQAAIPASVIPLGGVLLTSSDSSFSHAAATALTPAMIRGGQYFAADISLADGTYFTFAEKVPDVQLNALEIVSGGHNTLDGFQPGRTSGYTAVVPNEAEQVKVLAPASVGITVAMTISNYLQADVPITDPDHVALVPGVNKLRVELSNGSSSNAYSVDIIRRLAVGSDGKIGLNAGSVSASSYQPNTSYVPAKVVDGNWEDPESRWSASGQGQWLQFDLGQPQSVTYLQIAFLNARERLSTFEIVESNDPDFATSTVLLAKRKSRSLLPTDSILQPYVLDKPASARYVRLIGYGNSASGSSGNWNSLTEIALYTGTPPVIVEPEEPTGPPQAGDTPEGPEPVLEIIEVSSAAELQTALDQARPGIEIRLNNGSYEQNGPFVIKDKQGTAALPIRIKAKEQGKAVIKGNSYLHIENAKHVEVSGLVFNSGIGTPGLDYRGVDPALAAVLKAEDSSSATVPKRQFPNEQVHPGVELNNSSNISILKNRFALDETGQPYRFNAPDGTGQVWCLTNIEGSCRIGGGDHYIADRPVYSGDTPHTNPSLVTDNGTHRHFIRVEGESSHNRIAYNDIGPKKGFGATITYNGKEGGTVSQYDTIEYNYFHDIGPRVTNGLEVIRLGLSGLSLASGYVTIQHNLFEGLNAEDEIISVKSSDNIVRYNTIRNSYGGIVARHGHRNSFYGNFIIGDGKTPGLSGFRIYGSDHKIYNNYMEGLTTNVIRLDGGTHDAGPDGGVNPTVRWMEGASEQTAVLNTLPPDKQTEVLRGHWRQYNVEIFNNTIVNVGNNTSSFSFGGRVYQPVGTKVYNNVVFSNAGTVFNETSAAQNVPENERQIYVGNMVEGIANPTNITNSARIPSGAIDKKPLQLVRSTDGLIRLSANSPAIDASKAPFLPREDMDGQTRYSMPDAGADEYNRMDAPSSRPLTAADVGPNAGLSVEDEAPKLTALSIQPNGESIPGFHPDVTYYGVTVPSDVSSVRVAPDAAGGNAVIAVSTNGMNRHIVADGQWSEPIVLAQDVSIVTVEVSLPSGKSRTYTIAVKRETTPAPGTDMPLDRIAFAQDKYSMKINTTMQTVVQAVYQGSVKPLQGVKLFTAYPEIATVDENGILTGRGKGTTVVAAVYQNYYATASVVVNDDTPEAAAGLLALGLDSGTELKPGFDTRKTMYHLTVPAEQNRLTLVPTALASGSVITVNVDDSRQYTAVSGMPVVLELAQDSRVIVIEVSLPSGSNKVYTLIVKRKQGSTNPPGGGDSGGSGDSDDSDDDSDSGGSSSKPASQSPSTGGPAPETPRTPIPAPSGPDSSNPVPPLPSGQPPAFTDTGKHWAADTIAQAARLGIVNGFQDGSFRPDDPMTRLQFAAMLVRSLKLKATTAAVTFADQSDIPGWAAGEIAAAVQAGILQGYEDQTLRPNQVINRAEMITMLLRAQQPDKESGAVQALTFVDMEDIPQWAQSAVSQAAAAGIVQGKEDNRFAPNDTATRAESVTVLLRMLERSQH